MNTNKRIRNHHKQSRISDEESGTYTRPPTIDEIAALKKALTGEIDNKTTVTCQTCGCDTKLNTKYPLTKQYCSKCKNNYLNTKCFITPAQKEALKKYREKQLEVGSSEIKKTSEEDMQRMIQEFLSKREVSS